MPVVKYVIEYVSGCCHDPYQDRDTAVTVASPKISRLSASFGYYG